MASEHQTAAATKDSSSRPSASDGSGARFPLIASLAGVLFLGAVVHRALSSDVLAAGFTSIDTRRSRVEPIASGEELPAWVDPRWRTMLSARLAEYADVSVFDPPALRALESVVEELPFIAEVRNARVEWPDGLQLDVRFREPVACVRLEDDFYSVSREGAILPGRFDLPPTGDGGSGEGAFALPMLGPHDGALDHLRPGHWIEGDDRWDALVVVLSMREHLSTRDLADLGRIVVDARRADDASITEPGIVIDLEHRRRILFGRLPDGTSPGELPAATKWSSVASALELLRRGEDWELVDVRWDQMTMQWRRSAQEDEERESSATSGE